jgi:MinD-like ATPase involved in chromosome partitioning or flagellar assembly
VTPFLLVSRSVEYETRLRSLLDGRLTTVAGEFLTFGTEAVIDRIDGDPRVALLGPVLNFEETRGLVSGLLDRHPNIGLIVVREQRSDLEDWVDDLPLHAVLSPLATDDTTLELIDRLSAWLVSNGRADADDFANPHLDDTRLVDSDVEANEASDGLLENEPTFDDPEVASGTDLQEEIWDFPPLQSGVQTEAIAVLAPKGGQGKTTIAINLATGLAEVAHNSVVLVDADLQFGDISTALNLRPERTIVEATGEDAIDELVLKTTLTHHEDGFFVVASAPSPEQGDRISAEALGRLIQRLRGTFRYVVVDTTPGLGEHTLGALEHVTDAVFVTTMSVASLRAMRTEFELLTTLGLMPGNRHIALNQVDKNTGLTVRDAENLIGAPVDVQVPRSPAVLLASNRGVPLIHDDVRDPAAKAVRSIVTRIAPEAFPKRSKIQRRRRSNETH